ncbi:GNAT family N-acetyltransferase [Teredinibacter turnerae]|uniref:GNAT family N-acetyltransferase n=2 Tax=Teredinibacter turnerae TaxID=2426 RepID=UPI001E2D68B3|nr:GNAT family N-acetyltransferase [Teredinibacter turnerae]
MIITRSLHYFSDLELPADMLIRNTLQATDIGRIILLHSEYYSATEGYDHTFEAYVAEPLAQFALRTNPKERIWIAESNNQIVGVICICDAGNNIAQLRWYIVHPNFQGTGLGKQLLTSAIKFCSQHNYLRIRLWTAKGLDSAKTMYLRNGFSLVAEKTHAIWGAERTEQCYEKPLG